MTHRIGPISRVGILATVLVLAMTACGDDAATTTTAASVPGDDATTADTQPATDATGWCGAVIEFDAYLGSLPIAMTDEELREQVQDILPRFRIIASGAPGEVRSDADLLLGGFEAIAAGDDSPMFDPAYGEAFDSFEAFVLADCGYQMEG